MLTLQETKDFLRLDGDDEDALVSSLIVTAKELTEGVLRRKLTEFKEVPETVHQAMLIVVATLYEERQRISREWTSRKLSTLFAECCSHIDGRHSNGHRKTEPQSGNLAVRKEP